MQWFRSICARNDVTPVGWVERSVTHQRRCVWRWVSLRSTHPTKTRFRDLAAHCVRGLLSTSRPLCQRVQGRPGACCTRGLACDLRKQNCTRAYRAAGAFRPSLRNGFTAYFVLFPENGSLPPSPPRSFASLGLSASTAAPEPHDFAVRSSCTRQSQLLHPSHLTARS